MAKTSKKALGIGLAGVMSVGAISGAISAVNVADAAESKAQQDAKGLIAHTIWSINNNYAGIKNQATWEGYIKEAEGYVRQMPSAESAEAAELTKQIQGLKDIVNAIACINQVEKSMTPKDQGGFGNFLGIKNVAQWKDYLDKAQEAMKGIDKSVFQSKYDELLERYNKVSANVQDIEDKHNADLKKVEEQYESAKKNASLKEAEAALVEAKKLGTHETSAEIVKKIEELIEELNKTANVTGASIVDTKNIKLEGTGLHNIKASDVTVEGCTVDSVKVSDDLKSLNVALKDEISPNIERTVKVKLDGREVEFKIYNGLKVEKVEVVSQNFGHNKTGQKVKVLVNGKEMDVDYIKSAGYTVQFVATKKDGTGAGIFAGTGSNTHTSDSGLIASNITPGQGFGATHKVEVQLTKGADIITGTGNIGIYNIDDITEISRVSLANINPSWDKGNNSDVKYELDELAFTNANGSGNSDNIAYKLSSNTLVIGEEAAVFGVYNKIEGKEKLIDESRINIETSNSSVVSVGKRTGGTTASYVLRAVGQGTATITVKVGDTEKKINITVTNQKRYLSKYELESNSVNVAQVGNNLTNNAAVIAAMQVAGATFEDANNGDVEIGLKTKDQYGDPIAIRTEFDSTGSGEDFNHVGGDDVIKIKGGTVKVPGEDKAAMFNAISVYTDEQEGKIGDGIMRLWWFDDKVYDANNPPTSSSSIFEKTPCAVAPYTQADLRDQTATYTLANNYLDPNNPGNRITTNFGTLSIKHVGADQNIDRYTLAPEKGTSNVVLKDDALNLKLSSFNSKGAILEDDIKVSANNFDAISTDESVAKVTIIAVGADTGKIQVTGVAAGEATIQVTEKARPSKKATYKVKVENEEVGIASVDPSSVKEITFNGDVKLDELMDITREGTGADNIVNGIKLTKTISSKVRVADAIISTTGINDNDLYIDYDNDGVYTPATDTIIGSVKGAVLETSENSGSKDIVSPGTNASDMFKIATNVSVKGKVAVQVVDVNGKIVGSNTFTVNINR